MRIAQEKAMARKPTKPTFPTSIRLDQETKDHIDDVLRREPRVSTQSEVIDKALKLGLAEMEKWFEKNGKPRKPKAPAPVPWEGL
jgi:hypothetical protein